MDHKPQSYRTVTIIPIRGPCVYSLYHRRNTHGWSAGPDAADRPMAQQRGLPMAHTQRKQTDSAGQPTISVRAERGAQGLAAERTALHRRRLLTIGIPGLALVLLMGGLLYARGSQPSLSPAPLAEAPTAVAAAAQATAELTAQPIATAAPAAQATAEPIAQPIATAAPAAVSAQPTSAAVTSSGVVCPDIAGLPIYANATCIERETDQDDGIIKIENTYLASASTDTVRRFYEGAFSQNGWAIAEAEHDVEDNAWSYTITQAQQRLKIEIEPGQGVNTAMSQITIAEK
jgi:hypothetical protein